MFKQLFLTLAAGAIFSINFAFGQQPDPVLFSVNNTPVYQSEFKYIYTKTNQDKADFSEASIREYLDLYVKFKLKVAKAREMRLDTIEALRSELDGYRRQLANSYLIDREVTDKLVKEAHERMLKDVEVSHIFFACDRNAKAADTLAAFSKAAVALKMIQGGDDFAKVAAAQSEDKSAKETGGYLGYVTAMFPDGFYSMEKGAYSAKSGDVFGPVRSNSGYHVVKVGSSRPARGEIEVGQILFRKGDSEEKNTMIRKTVDSVYAALQGGASWDLLCSKYSDDKTTAPKGGYLGFFGINRYQKSFEDAAFSIPADGQISSVVETSIGWHLIKRISHRPVGNFETLRRGLTERVKRDSRSAIAKQTMIARIQREGKFTEKPDALKKWAAQQVDSVFLTFRWKPSEPEIKDVLAQFGTEKTFTIADFEEFCFRASRERMRGAGNPLNETIDKLYQNWKEEVAMGFEESQLDKKYPDFKSLMREYEEGILLFDATKQLVWDKANTDSVGLVKFFNENLKEKYKWDERAEVSIYTIKTDDPKIIQKVREMAAKKPSADVLKKMNKKENLVHVITKTYEKGKNKDLDPIWQAGGMTALKSDAGTKTSTFLKVEKITPPTPKLLDDARGYAVADYQDYLEKKWIEDLRAAYPVKIDEAVVKSMVK